MFGECQLPWGADVFSCAARLGVRTDTTVANMREINPINAQLKDLAQRADVLRGYL